MSLPPPTIEMSEEGMFLLTFPAETKLKHRVKLEVSERGLLQLQKILTLRQAYSEEGPTAFATEAEPIQYSLSQVRKVGKRHAPAELSLEDIGL